MSIRNYTITVDDDTGVSIRELAERLREAGFDVSQQLDAIGVILGRAEDADVARIRGIRGVAAVEEERTVELRSPDDEPK